MVTLYVFGLIGALVLGFCIGKTRTRDRLPREIYDAQGRRVL